MKWILLAIASLSCAFSSCLCQSAHYCTSHTDCADCQQCSDGTCVDTADCQSTKRDAAASDTRASDTTASDTKAMDSKGIDSTVGIDRWLADRWLDDNRTADRTTQADIAPAADADSADTAPAFTELTWGRMTLPGNTATVFSIWGRSAHELYAATMTANRILKKTDGSWQPWAEVGDVLNNAYVYSIWGTADRIYLAAGTIRFLVHEEGVGFTHHSPTVSLDNPQYFQDVHGTDNNHIYTICVQLMDSALLRFDDSQLTVLARSMVHGTARFSAVHATAPDTAYVTSDNGKIFRYHNDTFYEEVLEKPAGWSNGDMVYVVFDDITSIEGELYAVASKSLVYHRQGGTWRIVHGPLEQGELHGISGLTTSRLEMFAVGTELGTGSQDMLYYNGTDWDYRDLHGNYSLYDIWQVSPDEWYIAGSVLGQMEGVILYGSR